jgi:adenine deaminase
MNDSFSISGNIVDVSNKRIYPGMIEVSSGKIKQISEGKQNDKQIILPGFIDSHIHIESSMLIPSEFARLAVVHGKIANVLGIDGIRFMIENGKRVPFKFYFGASSCVPATIFETAGAEITAENIKELFRRDGLHYMSEMMNFPGVLNNDSSVMDKINVAKEFGKPIDGHSPGLKGEDARKYISAGITTDHECFMIDEALDKLKYGMKILIREGSAAKNYETLHTLIPEYTDQIMFCSDDKHPNDLTVSHINELVRRSLKYGYDLFDVLKCACINPVEHYNLDVGLLKEGDNADFIVLDNFEDLNIKQTYINGQLVAEMGNTLISSVNAEVVNNFRAEKKVPDDFIVKYEGDKIRVIEALDGQLITNEMNYSSKNENGGIVSDTGNDLLKIVVVNRYKDEKPAIAFVKNFGFKKGAIASCVAHDSHNIIAVGINNKELCDAVNAVIEYKGGISIVYDGKIEVLSLPVAGIMTTDDGYKVAESYSKIDRMAKELGSKLHAPYMTLSFMALLVIPALKLSDKGLFDGSKFEFVDLCC